MRDTTRDALATVAAFAIALSWLKLCDILAARGILSSMLARKVVHIGTGPLFLTSWLLFSESPHARLYAVLVPLSITAQFAAIGYGLIRDDGAVRSMSRTGRASELLRGPLLYGLVFVAATVLGWRGSPTAVVSLSLLCGGDGAAEIVGRRWGTSTTRLPWSSSKSIVGSAAMFIAGLALALTILQLFNSCGYFTAPPALQVAAVAAVATAVESFPFADIDNITVATAAAAAALMLGWR